ncbi:protein of unknown function [Listeria monocytogenes R479a]|nr:hypothetical protein LMQOC2_21591 [Listeria monocytogenes QOC2]CDK43069.1 hypothetical protein LMQOC1_31268 [Listeria monocytogenes QOC1]CDM17039.1 protein of unknown function [Listeria monocytogenes R479a]CDN70241.1 hypothetical protein LM4423_70038 [Listeria monocytogenes 4423]CUK70252.1 hypothetical protein LM600983_150037 [Listeria monocytogenes]
MKFKFIYFKTIVLYAHYPSQELLKLIGLYFKISIFVLYYAKEKN